MIKTDETTITPFDEIDRATHAQRKIMRCLKAISEAGRNNDHVEIRTCGQCQLPWPSEEGRSKCLGLTCPNPGKWLCRECIGEGVSGVTAGAKCRVCEGDKCDDCVGSFQQCECGVKACADCFVDGKCQMCLDLETGPKALKFLDF